MKKLIYLSNIEVPYRVDFFNELSNYCDLTVLYERKISRNRNKEWSSSRKVNYKTIYLDGFSLGNESTFSLKILKHILGKYDVIIIGCYNTPMQMFTTAFLKFIKKGFYINIDGETFIKEQSLKSILKKIFLKGAIGYFVAGEKSAESLVRKLGSIKIFPYYFSSLSLKQIEHNSIKASEVQRQDYVLVIGQYYKYKGMDIALEAAKLDKNISYKFVGMGNRTDDFIKDFKTEKLPNVEIIPFMQKDELEKAYIYAKVLVLPSRQECWGLVINEAASYGTPIVSTWGSGAAIEFLADTFPEYLAQPNDSTDLLKCIKLCCKSDTYKYSEFLRNKSKVYSIESSIKAHLFGCDIEEY